MSYCCKNVVIEEVTVQELVQCDPPTLVAWRLVLHYHLTYTLQFFVYGFELLLNMRFCPLRYNLFDAFVSCGKALHEGQATEEDITKRVRELLDQLPWAHRPGHTECGSL